MKIFRRLIYLIPLFLLSSCIKSELQNTEADILQCILPADILKSQPKITNNDIMILVLPDKANITELAPEFVLTPGATISPASGTKRNFTEPQRYVVTSEDRSWKKIYTVRVIDIEMPTQFGFEHWAMSGKYETPYAVTYMPDGQTKRQDIWASGNPGYALTGMGTAPDKFPTCSTTEAYSGDLALKLETRSTGPFGNALHMPIAAGNLFIGTFDGANATKAPLKATHFGLPFGKKPISFKGYYRYKSGGDVTGSDNKPIVPARRDVGRIYAVLYETDEDTPYLDGTNGLTSPKIIAKAILENTSESNTYIPFNISFEYIRPFDPEKAAMFGYNLSIVFTSSKTGDLFEGAVGSTLYVDDVEIVTEESNAPSF